MDDDVCLGTGWKNKKSMFVGRQGGRCPLCNYPLNTAQAVLHCVVWGHHKDHSMEKIFALHVSCHEARTLCGK